MPRTKTVTLDNASFKISSFSVQEVEDLYPSPAPTRDSQAQMVFVKDMICRSLNKAEGKQDWTPQRIDAELDYPLIGFLYAEILKMCGLKVN